MQNVGAFPFTTGFFEEDSYDMVSKWAKVRKALRFCEEPLEQLIGRQRSHKAGI